VGEILLTNESLIRFRESLEQVGHLAIRVIFVLIGLTLVLGLALLVSRE
jgi:hypothetical protein